VLLVEDFGVQRAMLCCELFNQDSLYIVAAFSCGASQWLSIVHVHVYMQLKAMRKCSVTRGALLLSSREDFCNKPIKSSINGAA